MREKDPDILVDLMAVSTEFEGEVIVASLEGEGIPARVFGATGRTMSWMVAASDPIRVQVRRQDLEFARLALGEACEESVDLDWDKVDVGDPDATADERAIGDKDRVVATFAILVLVVVGALVVVAVFRSGVP